LNRYEPSFDTIVVFPEGKKPYSRYYSEKIKKILGKRNVSLLVNSYLGPVPIELDEMYPFAQSVFPEIIDKETTDEVGRIFSEFTKNRKIIFWKGSKTLQELSESKDKKREDVDLRRISAVVDMQFGKGASKALLNGNVEIVKSKNTDKIRNVHVDGHHILSMRAEDGLFTLKMGGAQLLHSFFKFPKLRVTVKEDAVPFIREGKSVFAKFVVDCDPNLRPFDECLIVDEKDNLLAVGRTLLNRDEMISFEYGMAVKTREAIV
jgi:7-cyano-7-deazaguanine tRNA-ribosyltransferase